MTYGNALVWQGSPMTLALEAPGCQDMASLHFQSASHSAIILPSHSRRCNACDHYKEMRMALITVLDPALERLVDPHTPAEKIATGCTFTEGPVWHQRDQRLFFSDI